jgi:hypothetical protein
MRHRRIRSRNGRAVRERVRMKPAGEGGAAPAGSARRIKPRMYGSCSRAMPRARWAHAPRATSDARISAPLFPHQGSPD